MARVAEEVVSERHERAKDALTRALSAMVHPIDHSVALGWTLIALVHLADFDDAVERLTKYLRPEASS